jgi:hypothetical protein
MSQGAVRVLLMRRLLALTAVAATALLTGCAAASTSAGAVADTKTPAPVPTADVESIVDTCYEAGIDFYADGVVDGKRDLWHEDQDPEGDWAYAHSTAAPTVERIDGGYSVLFHAPETGGAPGHLCELTEGGASITVVRD